MAINITSNYSNPQTLVYQKFHNAYKNSVDEKKVTQKNNPTENSQVADIKENSIRDFLSVDEKRVLKEVFGDFNVDKNSGIQYGASKNVDFLKGSQIDIRL